MMEEFEIAKSMNKFIIPVGFTKSLAQELWKQFNDELPAYLNPNDFQKLEKITEISEKSINESVQTILKLIKRLNPQNS